MSLPPFRAPLPPSIAERARSIPLQNLSKLHLLAPVGVGRRDELVDLRSVLGGVQEVESTTIWGRKRYTHETNIIHTPELAGVNWGLGTP